jgi:glycosyltransferase involved in cell wall biosynthesis
MSEGTIRRVLIIGDAFSFPFGTGAAVRTCAIARQLHEAGVAVRVMVTRATELDEGSALNREPRGVYRGVPYEYATGTTIRPNAFWRRRWIGLRSLWRQLQMAALERPRFDVVLISTGSSLFLPLAIGSLSRLRGAVLLYEGCELPFIYEQPRGWRALYARLYARWLFKIYDGVLVVSERLHGYFSSRIRRSAAVIRLPVLVDVAEFGGRSSCQPRTDRTYLLYAGSLHESKGVDGLVRAFARIAPQHPEVELRIAGDSEAEDRDRIVRLIDSLGLQARARYLGFVRREEVPGLFVGARALVLPHRAGEHTRAAFPTKLAEYLASGRPVVAARVGEIDRYLADGLTAYLTPPDDPEALAVRLRHVLEHPDAAEAVGRRGQEVAEREFDARRHVRRVLAELEPLLARR